MHSDKHKALNIFHRRVLCNILYENVLHVSLDDLLPFTFEVFLAIFFPGLPTSLLLHCAKQLSCRSQGYFLL